MYERRLLLVASLLLLCVAFVPSAFAQLPKRLERCLPYPTLAQEVRERQLAQLVPERVRVHVVRVDFDPNDGIPTDAQDRISAELQSIEIESEADTPYLKNLANEIAEVGVKGALRDRGYFTARTTAKITELWRDGVEVGVVASVRATPGPQYRTGDIQIKSADPDRPLTLSPEALRAQIPLQKGDVFSTERVRAGMEKLGRVYGREGYIDMTPEPNTEVDEARRIIDLVVKIDEQVQYRVGSIDFLGVNAATREKLLESLPKTGEALDRDGLEEFLRANQASEADVSIRRNNKAGTVAIVFDLVTCPAN
jgi:outer membrane protein assembly factor BamA